MSLSDNLADIAATRQINLARYDSSLRSRVIALLKDVEAEIYQKLLTDKPWSEFARERLNKQLADIRQILNFEYLDISKLTSSELAELAVIEAQWQAKSVNKEIGVDLLSAMPTESQLEALAAKTLIQGAVNKDWWARQSQDTQFRFLTAVRTGVAQGETNAQLVGRVKSFMNVSKRNAEALVRTSVQTVASEARRSTIRANSDVIKGIQQVSVLDSRTSEICMAYSGAAWNLEGKPVGEKKLPYGSGVPRHWSCRSFEIPVTKTFRELGLDADEFPKGTRSSIDGQVARDLSFDEWLKSKPDSVQNEMLGVGKAQLFRSGKITLTDLVNGDGNPLTLAELKKL